VKYNFIIEHSLKTTSLKRVRIKVDPKFVNAEADLSNCDGYEGYVLAECGVMPKVLVVSPDFDNGVSVMDIPGEHLEDIESNDEQGLLNQLKFFILQKRSLDINSPEAQLIISSNTIENLEAALKSTGVSDDEVKVLYRTFILDENVNLFNEISIGGILRGAGKVTSTVAKGAGSVAGFTGRAMGSLGYSNAAAGLGSIGSGLKGVGSFIEKMVTKSEERTLKKLTRPDGDPKRGQKVILNVPDISREPLTLKIDRIQKTGKGNILFIRTGKLTPSPGNKPIDEISITDNGDSYGAVTYQFEGRPVIPDSKWPKSAGFHYDAQEGNLKLKAKIPGTGVVQFGQWVINNDTKSYTENQFSMLRNFVMNYKPEGSKEYYFDDRTQQLIRTSRSMTQLREAVLRSGIKREAYDKILDAFYNPSGRQVEPEPELEPEVETQPEEQPEPTTPPTTFKGRNKGMSKFLRNKALQRHTGVVSGMYGGKPYPPPGTDVLAQQDETKAKTLKVMSKYYPK